MKQLAGFRVLIAQSEQVANYFLSDYSKHGFGVFAVALYVVNHDGYLQLLGTA